MIDSDHKKIGDGGKINYLPKNDHFRLRLKHLECLNSKNPN